MKANIEAGVALAKIGAIALNVGMKVMSALPGGITAEEAEQIALAAIGDEDIKIKVRGVDVMDAETQGYFVKGIARFARNLADVLA